MPPIQFAKRFLQYYFKAQTRYNVHSPFVFNFTENVLEDDRLFYPFMEVEVLRGLLLHDQTKLPITDYGAGSKVSDQPERTVASLARFSATMPTFCRILFRLINYYKPRTMLELGTSLGISSMYQATAALNSTLITIEGCDAIADQAIQNFNRLEVKNIKVLKGRFEEMLPKALKEIGVLDYVFVDGNHRKEPTLRYFKQCLEYAHEGSIFVFDDIHWSNEMEAAWHEIQKHPCVQLSLDLFFFGIVFFKEELKGKAHYSLIKSSWKPWKVGLKDLFADT